MLLYLVVTKLALAIFRMEFFGHPRIPINIPYNHYYTNNYDCFSQLPCQRSFWTLPPLSAAIPWVPRFPYSCRDTVPVLLGEGRIFYALSLGAYNKYHVYLKRNCSVILWYLRFSNHALKKCSNLHFFLNIGKKD